jgi:tetratricopeptide (TPR) repeat protein
MAIKDMQQSVIPNKSRRDQPTTFLPSFPSSRSILGAIPEVIPETVELGKTCFIGWVDFTLENPDEIWEIEQVSDIKIYHYLSFFGNMEGPPVFAVEVRFLDEVLEINDFALILVESEVTVLRSGNLVYCRRLEWEKERLVRALNEQALTKYDQDRLDEARELIDSAIRLSGYASAYLFNNRGLICWKMGKIDEAKQDFLESIHLDSENGDPYFNIGLIYFDECDLSHALHYLRKAVDISPLDSQFLTELAHLYLELDREDEALQLFERAFENDPADAQVDFHLGHYFLYKKCQPRDAVRYYRQGLEKDPHDQFALADLALAHWILGNKRKTLAIHKIIQTYSNLMPYTISRLVYLNMEMGDYESALKYYRKALSQSDPFELEWLHYNAAIVYAKTGRSKQALDILDLAVKAGGEAVIRKALSEKALEELKRLPDFKKLVKLPSRRRNR